MASWRNKLLRQQLRDKSNEGFFAGSNYSAPSIPRDCSPGGDTVREEFCTDASALPRNRAAWEELKGEVSFKDV